MIGLEQFSSFEECLDFLKEHDGFNGIVVISLYLAPDKIYKEYFACDRFESFFDGLLVNFTADLNTVKEIFNEPFSEINISYRLMPRGKRTEPIVVTTRMKKEQIRQINDIGVDIVTKTFEVLYKEVLYGLIEGK